MVGNSFHLYKITVNIEAINCYNDLMILLKHLKYMTKFNPIAFCIVFLAYFELADVSIHGSKCITIALWGEDVDRKTDHCSWTLNSTPASQRSI